MASSKSLQEGQILISCQLCEESIEIKWKCLQCDFLLCTKCKKLHEKVKSTYQHTIIDIKDIASHLQQAKDSKVFRNIQCEVHSGHNCCLFCQTCDKVVCPSCIAETHTKHDMIELSEGYKLTVKKIKTFNSELGVKSSNCQKGLADLSLFKSSEDFKYMSAKQSIESREKVLKYEVEMHTKKIMKEIDQRWDRQTKSVNDAYIKSQKIHKDLEFRSESLTNALASVNTNDVFNAYKEEKIARKQSMEPVNVSFKRLQQYFPGKLQIQQTLHGELAEPDDNYSLEQSQFKVMTKFKTGLNNVEMITVCADGTLWISNSSDNILQKIHFSTGVVKVMQNIQVFCSGMALLKSGDLLISSAKSNLKILSHTTGKLKKTKYSVAPLITGHIHITKEDNIIIRARTEGPVFPVNGPRKIVVMNIEGRTETIYDLDNNGKPIFCAPQKMTTDKDNNIYVIDNFL